MIIVSCMKFPPLEQASNPVSTQLPHNKVWTLNWKTKRGEETFSNVSSRKKWKNRSWNSWAYSGDSSELLWETRWTSMYMGPVWYEDKLKCTMIDGPPMLCLIGAHRLPRWTLRRSSGSSPTDVLICKWCLPWVPMVWGTFLPCICMPSGHRELRSTCLPLTLIDILSFCM